MRGPPGVAFIVRSVFLSSHRGVVTATFTSHHDHGAGIFADALSKLSVTGPGGEDFRIEVTFADRLDEEWRARTRGMVPATEGVLAELPTPPHITIRRDDTSCALWWRDAGVVHGEFGSGRVHVVGTYDDNPARRGIVAIATSKYSSVQ